MAGSSRPVWRAWLAEHHQTAVGAWLVTGPSAEGLGYDAAVEEALCFGWVDSTARRLEDGRRALYFAPRRPGSGWAASNKTRVARLTEAGLMTAAGLRLVERARADGSWNALDAVEALEVPDDLAAAFRDDSAAAAAYDALTPGRRKQVLRHVVSAKRAETRARRVRQVLDALRGGTALPG